MTEKYFNGLHPTSKPVRVLLYKISGTETCLNRLGDAAIYLSDWIRKRLH
jgi:hypothetical protein